MSINTKLYIEKFLKIKTKEAKIVPFLLNKPQLKLYELIKQQYQLGKPIRIIILKARQMGFSTVTEGIIFKRTATKQNVSSAIVAHISDSTRNLFNMSKLFLQELPKELQPKTKASNSTEIIFDTKEGTGLRSKIKCFTAGGEGVGRSDTIQNLHASEISSWNNAKEVLDGLLQAVPYSPDTMVILESTAKGYDHFKELWDKAVDGESDFIPLFCAWHEMEEYRLPVPKDFKPTEEEIELKKLYNLDNEQLCWRRWCIRNSCGGDINTFRQEYPSCPEEAFLATGECIFDKDLIVKQIEKIRSNANTEIKGEFVYKKIINPIKGAKDEVVGIEKQISNIEFVSKENGMITLHTGPEVRKDSKGRVIAQRQYSIGGDTAALGDDFFTAKVVTNDTQQTVATLRKQRIDEDLYADQVYCLGKYYHDALIGIETNYSYGPTKELVELSYPNMYMRERFDKTFNEITKVYGFNTNKQTKNVITTSLVAAMREDADNEVDIATLKEMLVFVRKENGSREAQAGYHDDLVMAKAIANFISQQQGDSNWKKIEIVEDDLLSRFFKDSAEDDSDLQNYWDDF